MFSSTLLAGVALSCLLVRRKARMVAVAAVLSTALSGCGFDHNATGSVGDYTAYAGPSRNLEASANSLGDRYKTDPSDAKVAVDYAATLRRLDRNAQAVAVLETATIKHPFDRVVLAAYGKALVDVGRFKEAASVLERAHTPDNPDWTILSAQGSAADQLGDHRSAQNYYGAALKIAPGNPHILSNLGLSYALDRQLPQAEQVLRQAGAAPGADMRVRQNLALVLALEGKSKEAQVVAERDQSPADAAANVAAIEDMIAHSPTWQGVKQPGVKVRKIAG